MTATATRAHVSVECMRRHITSGVTGRIEYAYHVIIGTPHLPHRHDDVQQMPWNQYAALADVQGGGHAREAAIAIWGNNLAMCRRCHFQGRRDCQQFGCHMGQFPSHPSSWKRIHGLSPWSRWNTGCDCHQWNPYEHNGVFFCQICHAVKPKGAKP